MRRLQRPVFLVNSRVGPFAATLLGSRSKFLHLSRALLLPKLRSEFAEFLNEGSLKRLRIFSPPTCVGLRYGCPDHSLEVFPGGRSQSVGLPEGALPRSPRVNGLLDLPGSPPTIAAGDDHRPVDLSSRVTPSYKRGLGRAGMLTCYPSPTPFGLGLGAA